MKLAQTTLSRRDKISARLGKLRRSDLFVENQFAQDSQLRRSGIFRRRADAAPTELNNFLIAVDTKIPLLRRCGTARENSSFSLTPRLQPGVKRNARIENRFNGLSARTEAVETAGDFSARAVHRAEATVLMREAVVGN
jgi:hypothetical protein